MPRDILVNGIWALKKIVRGSTLPCHSRVKELTLKQSSSMSRGARFLLHRKVIGLMMFRRSRPKNLLRPNMLQDVRR